MNRIEILGNLTELKELQKGIRVTIAVKREYKNQNGEYDTDFIDCYAFQKNADYIKLNTEKGSPILIIGSVHKNKKEYNGTTYYEHDIWVEKVNCFSRKSKQESKPDNNPTFNTNDLPF